MRQTTAAQDKMERSREIFRCRSAAAKIAACDQTATIYGNLSLWLTGTHARPVRRRRVACRPNRAGRTIFLLY